MNLASVFTESTSCLTFAGPPSYVMCHFASQLFIEACAIGPGQQMERNSFAFFF